MNVPTDEAYGGVDSPAAWLRLLVAMTLSTIGGVGMWSIMVALPTIQADFGVSRANASLPFTMVMFGFAGGGVLMGRLADRFGIAVPLALGTLAVSAGYLATGWSFSLWQVALAHLLIGIGCSASFGPLMADISHWFVRRRGIAVSLAAVGNYVAGTIWPPVLQHFITTSGWRATHIAVGLFCLVTMMPLVLFMRRRIEDNQADETGAAAAERQANMPVSPMALQVLLCTAGVACCVAMAMPQVHIVAYCGDLGYGVARGAEMLSMMLGFGIISRVGSGFIADRIGGVATLLLGSVLQGTALFLFSVVRRPRFALHYLCAVRPLPGRHRAELCHHHTRVFFAARSRHAPRHCPDGNASRNGAWRLAVWPDLRPDRLLSRRVLQRPRMESGECVHHGMAAAALAPARSTRRSIGSKTRRPAIPSWSRRLP
jgi:MFS family permease